MKTKLICLFLLAICYTTVSAQEKHLTKLVLEKDQTYFVEDSITSIIVDTLIMEDNTTLYFPPEQNSVFRIKTAFIGKDCVISTMGITGQDAGNLDIQIHFNELTSLTIDARGADGVPGIDGKDERVSRNNSRIVKDAAGNTVSLVPGSMTVDAAGTYGTPGGIGGNGGHVIFKYSTDGFTPNFNRKVSHQNITILNKEGADGRNGKNGKNAKLYHPKHPTSKSKKKEAGKVEIIKLEDRSL